MRSVVVARIVELSDATVVLVQRRLGDGWKASGGDELQALSRGGLVPAQQTFQHIVTGSENIAHIVKDGEAETFSEVRQADLGKAQFLTVDEQRRAADGKTGIGIAGSCLI